MEAEIKILITYYENKIITIKNTGDALISKTILDIDVNV